tara:strand:+ start:162 stop:269 length:108 start_codon:yes stop_codon:yes gene_type:complete
MVKHLHYWEDKKREIPAYIRDAYELIEEWEKDYNG